MIFVCNCRSPIFDQTESAGGSGSPEIPYGSDTLKRAAKTNREVSRELFKKMEESRTGAAKKPLRNSQSDSPLEQKYSFVALSAVQSDPEMISSPTKLIRLPSSSSSSYRSSPKGSEKCRTATSSTTGSPNLTCRSRCSDTSGYSASRSSGEPTR